MVSSLMYFIEVKKIYSLMLGGCKDQVTGDDHIEFMYTSTNIRQYKWLNSTNNHIQTIISCFGYPLGALSTTIYLETKGRKAQKADNRCVV